MGEHQTPRLQCVQSGLNQVQVDGLAPTTTTVRVQIKQIDGAKQIWALEEEKADTATPTWGDLVTDYIKKKPTCNSGGTYSINAVNADPACSTGGDHAL